MQKHNLYDANAYQTQASYLFYTLAMTHSTALPICAIAQRCHWILASQARASPPTPPLPGLE